MTTHCLQCSVCGQEFNLKEKWNNHLLTSSHQKPAQNECEQCWWEEPSIRQCCAVLFSSCQITNEVAADLVSFFGNKLPGRFLTDFSLSRGNPQVAVLQFESKKVVKTVVKETQGGSVTVNGKLVQIKRASDILELQWKHLFHPVLLPEPTQLPLPAPSKKLDLVNDFNWIRSCTVISPANWKKFNVILQLIPTILRKSNPKVFLFRNYVQGIKFNGTQQILIFLCKPDTINSVAPLDSTATNDFIKESGRIPLLSNFTITEVPVKTIPGQCFQFQHGNAKLELSLVTDFWFVHEVQLSRMLDYLCKFDSRLKGVLTLTAFWSNSNKIFLTNHRLRNGDVGVTPAADPNILQWMVVLYLTKEKIIPSVKCIMERPHQMLLKPVVIKNSETSEFLPVDIGFNDSDNKFLTDWRSSKAQPEENSNEWLESVITLTSGMFRFYSSRLKSTGHVLIPQTGEILPCKEFVRTRQICNFDTLRARIRFAHPLNDHWKLPICTGVWRNTVRSQMKETADNLDKFLAGGGHGKLQEALCNDLKTETNPEKWLDSWNVLSKGIR